MVEYWKFGNQSEIVVLYVDMIAIAFDKLRNIPTRKSYPSWMNLICSQYWKTFDTWMTENCDVYNIIYPPLTDYYVTEWRLGFSYQSINAIMIIAAWWLISAFSNWKSMKYTNNTKCMIDWIRSAHSKRHRYISFWKRFK